ncbi:MAG: hypothetical protein KAG61_07445 [Bacteriovoracaceae bacterium]|nr:hypothetical protein [Bacteriovoracaceae bacterium]
MRPVVLLLLTLIWGCTQAPPTSKECEVLSMHSFRGLPQAINKYKKHCLKLKLHYTKKLCEKALVDLVRFEDQNILKKKYGEQIMECFTVNDLEKFLKK